MLIKVGNEYSMFRIGKKVNVKVLRIWHENNGSTWVEFEQIPNNFGTSHIELVEQFAKLTEKNIKELDEIVVN